MTETLRIFRNKIPYPLIFNKPWFFFRKRYSFINFSAFLLWKINVCDILNVWFFLIFIPLESISNSHQIALLYGNVRAIHPWTFNLSVHFFHLRAESLKENFNQFVIKLTLQSERMLLLTIGLHHLFPDRLINDNIFSSFNDQSFNI